VVFLALQFIGFFFDWHPLDELPFRVPWFLSGIVLTAPAIGAYIAIKVLQRGK
jgi:hypothetical protein